MNAADIWSGQDYAYVDYISRGVMYYNNAKRCKVIRMFGEKLPGKKRETTMCEVFLLNDDGTHQTTYDGAERTRKIRARDIYARWEEHWEEKERRRIENEKWEAKYEEENRKRNEETRIRREQQERERIERLKREEHERKQRELIAKEERERLFKYLEYKGIPREIVESVDNGTITLNKNKFKQLVGMKEVTIA